MLTYLAKQARFGQPGEALMSALRLAQLPEDTRYQAWYPPTQDKGRLEEKLLLGTYGVTIAPIHRTTESRSLLGNTYT